MAGYDDKRLAELDAQMQRSDPRFAYGLDSGRPRRPREYRHRTAWIVLSTAVVILTASLLLSESLLIAPALVLAGVAGCLFDRRNTTHEREPRHPENARRQSPDHRTDTDSPAL